MARIINRLSPRFVMNAKPKGKPSPSGKWSTHFCDGGGLHLVCTVSADGLINRSWSFKYEIGGNKREGRKGRRRELGLGPAYDVPLAKAREKAAALRDMLRDGIDPLDERRTRQRALEAERARAVTFRQDAEAYMALHERGWSPKHARQWHASLEQHVYSSIGAWPVAQVDQVTLRRLIEPLWISKTVTAGRLINRIESVLAYATAHGHRQGDNPASNLLAALPKRSKITTIEHFAAVPYEVVPDVMAQLRKIETKAASALRFLILCASRAGEINACEWSEIDLKTKLWTIPGTKMKGRRRHRVPLSSAAAEVLEALPRHGKRAFAIGPEGMRYVLRKVAPGSTVHGFRTAFKQWATERTSFSRAAIELSLAHAVALDRTEDAYLRDADMFEKRRRLMQQWADFCSKPAAAKSTGTTTVVPMHAKVSPHA